ncbi:MAG: DUF2520 domain-containing protein [Myxococcales bacterium]|nr:DUF2520 domain-containing protein [Myxococcales bacterium]
MGGITHDQVVGLIGAGRLGSTLALALQAQGLGPSAVASATPARARRLAARLGGDAVETRELVARCDLVFLAVPDDALAELARVLPWRSEQRVVHLSGALELVVLEPARQAGARAGCLHPLQSFPEPFGAAERFTGICCGVEGDGPLGDELAALCTSLGARPLRLEGVDRAGYHLAAVFASNYVVALHVAAARAFELAGLSADDAREALAPLTLGAAGNVARLPLEQALTGPLGRGDVATIARHRDALASAPELRDLYDGLARALLELPLSLPQSARDQLSKLVRS